jgi:hypothetical protein
MFTWHNVDRDGRNGGATALYGQTKDGDLKRFGNVLHVHYQR